MITGTSELDRTSRSKSRPSSLTEAKIEDHEIHLDATEFTDHLPPVRRYQRADVVLYEIV
jgi:hypothetical protein